jgi:hypothetical protein
MMKSKSMRAMLVLALLVLIVAGSLWAFGYHTFEFKGGIGISDSGFFSYPRYHAEVGELPLWKNGEYSFTVHGLPPGPLDLALRVRDATYADSSELKSLSTSVSVFLTDNDGKQICTANGSLSDARDRAHSGWVLTSSDVSASFWHPGCQNLPISRFKTYTAKVVLSGEAARPPDRMVVLQLKGGGEELP